MEQNGSKLVKVISILMIIGGIVSAIVSLISVAGAGLITAVSGDAKLQQAATEAGTSIGTVTAFIWISVIIMVISAIIEIIAGVKGIKNWDNPAAAQSLVRIGIVCVALTIIGSIIAAIGGSFSIISLIFSLVLPVLYIIGAVKLKNNG